MNVKYYDPYKEDPYGKLRGEKGSSYFEVEFDEAILHPTDDGYALAGNFPSYNGIIRNFKSEPPLEAGLCAIPLYSKDYSIRSKVAGKWIDLAQVPFTFEKFLCTYIKANEASLIGEGKALSGKFAHIPDGMCIGKEGEQMCDLVQGSLVVTQIDATGKLPAYTVPGGYNQRKGGGGFSRGASLEEKMTLVKKELVAFAQPKTVKEDDSLGTLVTQVWSENVETPEVLQYFFDTLQAVIR